MISLGKFLLGRTSISSISFADIRRIRRHPAIPFRYRGNSGRTECRQRWAISPSDSLWNSLYASHPLRIRTQDAGTRRYFYLVSGKITFNVKKLSNWTQGTDSPYLFWELDQKVLTDPEFDPVPGTQSWALWCFSVSKFTVHSSLLFSHSHFMPLVVLPLAPRTHLEHTLHQRLRVTKE